MAIRANKGRASELKIEQEWKGVLSQLREEIGEDHFTSWFPRARLEREISSTNDIHISVPTDFLRQRISDVYKGRMREIWKEIGGRSIRIMVSTRNQGVLRHEVKTREDPEEKKEKAPIEPLESARIVTEKILEARRIQALRGDADRELDVILWAVCGIYKMDFQSYHELPSSGGIPHKGLAMLLAKRNTKKTIEKIGWYLGNQGIEETEESIYELEKRMERSASFAKFISKIEKTPEILSLLPNKHPSISDVISVVSKHFGISRGDLLSETRAMNIVLPRQIAISLSKNYARKKSEDGFSLPELGRAFGGRDHTTILHSANKIDRRIKNTSELWPIEIQGKRVKFHEGYDLLVKELTNS